MKKIMKKNNYYFIILIFLILIYIISLIILLCKSRKKYEKFTLFQNKGINLKSEKKIKVNNKSSIFYYLEHEKINKLSIDNFFIFDKYNQKIFYTNGIWNLDEFNMDIISTTGGKLSINTNGNNLYSFNINDYEINFTYNHSKKTGKLHIYSNLKEEYDIDFIYKNNSLFLFKINNEIIASIHKIKNIKNKNIKYKIEFNNSYDQIRQIFIIITIIYLHIIKNFKLKFDDLLL